MSVRIWSEKVSIPTYGVGKQEKNPMFFEKRVYQGSTGKVYPHPVIDKIENEKKEQEYLIVFIENDYIQVQIMPEVGGRIYRAIDKTNDYDFVYHNKVMKPALIGLTGPWVSGGIEFNWPQHHRPNTFGPVDYWLDDSQEEIKTVWMAERDRMYGTKVSTGISLRNKVSRIEITSELYNPTSDAQTFLWWANPAVAVHDETQSIFPPDVHAVMDHGKRAVSKFPIATGTYYKYDYSKGVDISRYKNIPVPTSYMAYHSDFDFVGSYDWKKEAGLLHVANHHVAPGKKQWTWGNGDFGQAWDRNLTDEDGPYIELMTGVFTDNQPDFTWLAPYSGKSFTQYFMPYKKVGNVSCASKDIVSGIVVENEKAKIKIYASLPLEAVRIVLKKGRVVLLDETTSLSPEAAYEKDVVVNVPAHLLTLKIEANGAQAVEYAPDKADINKTPSPAKAIKPPETLANNEALLLAAMHLEQYRHATFEPDAYYIEGLKREPDDMRINNAYGNLLLKRGQFKEALECFEKAKKTATRHSPNPYDGEVFFNLGKAYEFLKDDKKAFDAYFKACWTDALKTQGYAKLAQIAARESRWQEALEYAQEALYSGAKNLKARAACTILLRLSKNLKKATECARKTLEFDHLDFCALRELTAMNACEGLASYPEVLRGDAHNHMELAKIYAELGEYKDAVAVLDDYLAVAHTPYAMVLYARAHYLQLANSAGVAEALGLAAKACPDYCFPNMVEEYIVLLNAIHQNPNDARANYYLGCFLYDKRRHNDAAVYWEKAAELDAAFPTVFRNLSLYYANKRGDFKKALSLLEKAFALNKADARVFYELCDLHKKMGKDPAEQCAMMEAHSALVKERDDLVIGYAEALNVCEEHEKVLQLLLNRKFHPWEGGEGKVPAQHITARLGIARKQLAEGNAQSALEHLQKATDYYHNFGEGKLTGAQENNIYFTMGQAYRALGNEAMAIECFEKATTGLHEPSSAIYYYDQPPHMIFYQGLALRALGRENEACGRFNKLVDYGEQHVFEHQVMDYFAVSMPDFMVFETDLDDKNKTHCYYMMGLGFMGLKKNDAARVAFEKALSITANHYGVMEHMALLNK